MRIKFWGVRGSAPTPEAQKLEYGGNTSCVELRLPDGGLLILDAGYGIRNLGLALQAEHGAAPVSAQVFLSHYHWDHIQGIPFFAPLYGPKNRVVFHAAGFRGSVRKMLQNQMADPYFPVLFDAVGADREFVEMDRAPVSYHGVSVHAFEVNHPQRALGYRIEADGAVVVYAPDREHGDARLDALIREYSQGADLLITDAQYTPEEYESKRGWGHSTWLECIRLAEDAKVRELMFFHHDPGRSDAQLAGILESARERFPNCFAAKEGFEIAL
ncbi:MAG: MBL fold metallo-hydrolase [Bryobacteraceae bacterium]|nr:MBL fold metallo-hydrolase [Bryobacteraceae bacterium]